MIKLTETYTWQQAAVMSKFDKLQIELEMIAFVIDGVVDDIYLLSQQAAIQGMIYFDQRMENNLLNRKDYLLENFPKFDIEKRFRYKINGEPTGEPISLNKLVGFDYKKKDVNVQDYTGCGLAYALLEPPYGINLKIDAARNTSEFIAIKTKEFTAIYRMFLNDFILLSEYNEEDLIIYSWSDDWSNFFDAGKEWWGTYYYTVYNKQNNTIIVLGASESD